MATTPQNLQTIANLNFIYKKINNPKDNISESLMNLSKTAKLHLRSEEKNGYNANMKDA